MKTKNYFLTLILAFSCSSIFAFATNYDVSVYTDGLATDVNTLRWAITQANAADGNTISFSGTPADITLNAVLPTLTKSVTINTGNTMITVIAKAATNVFTTSANKSVTLNYLTIKSATANALNINNATGTLTCNNCVFTGNNSTNGSIGRVWGGAVAFNYCTFTANNGSGIYTNSASTSISLDHCIFQTNTGGACVNVSKDGTVTLNISNSIFKNNTSTGGYGGAIASNAVTTITYTEFSGNTAARGGAVSLGGGTTTALSKLTMTGCTVSGNTANAASNGFGGGVYIQGASTNITDNTTITNCTISGNTATTAGGGLQVGGGSSGSWANTVTINNSTFVLNNCGGNVAASTGGGIDCGYPLYLNYSIVAGNNSNSTATKSDLGYSYANLYSTTGRNLIGYGGATSVSFGGIGTIGVGTVNLANTTAISTILNTTLADNGGTTLIGDGTSGYVKTHALVAACSAVNPVAAGSGLQTIDQRGKTRDLTPDMGAYELLVEAPGAPTAIVATAGNQQATVEFIAPINDGGSAILDYTVTPYDGETAGTAFTGASSPIIVTGLTNGTAYTFKVTARNAVGSSIASSASVAITPSVGTGITNPVVAQPIYQSGNTIVVDLSTVSGVQKINFYNVEGKNVWSLEAKGGQKLSFASILKQGIYFVKTQQGENSKTVKLFVK